ncbi:MAG: glycoside hydrolase family 2 TIM barrel-domain containing protein [Coprobacillus sp.]
MNLIDAIKTVRLFEEKEQLKPLQTRWGKVLDEKHVLEEYPRPQMIRKNYLNLNGFWNYTITNNKNIPKQFDGKILVPFSPECSLSTVNRQLQPNEYLWYERELPITTEKRCLLHFGAVDQIADVYINHQHVFHHIGGYLPFDIDITDNLKSEHNIVTVCVQDLSDTSYHSKGKQRLKRGGMYYTAQSGIWQTVWLEQVPETYIHDVKIIPNYDNDCIDIMVTLNHPAHHIYFKLENEEFSLDNDNQIIHHTLKIKNKISWTPDNPYLYPIKILTQDDEVECYFAMRTYTIEKDQNNIPRICLNHEPIFMHGVLDQGYWPDGLYTAPSDEALIYDIESMKSLGFNMIRKHIKIEPARWYYHCDRLGMIVWQDMVNGGTPYHTLFITWMPSVLSWTKKHISDKHIRLLSRHNKESQKEFIYECEQTIQHLSHFPCISTWILFNEAWGQFKTKELTEYLHQLDPTRLIDSTSGWYDQNCGDFRSEHHYFDEPKFIDDHRVFVLSEYGGYACQIKDHHSVDKVYGYKVFTTSRDFSKAYKQLLDQTVYPLINQGLCAAVYTQVSDIEEEVNGLLTYDREICKLKKE